MSLNEIRRAATPSYETVLRHEAREQTAGLEDMLLANDLGEPTRAHPRGERLVLRDRHFRRGRRSVCGEKVGLVGRGHYLNR